MGRNYEYNAGIATGYSDFAGGLPDSEGITTFSLVPKSSADYDIGYADRYLTHIFLSIRWI